MTNRWEAKMKTRVNRNTKNKILSKTLNHYSLPTMYSIIKWKIVSKIIFWKHSSSNTIRKKCIFKQMLKNIWTESQSSKSKDSLKTGILFKIIEVFWKRVTTEARELYT